MAVRVEGLDLAVKAISAVGDRRLMHEALGLYAGEVKAAVAPYPPESEANRPPAPYYKRHYGTVGVTKDRRTSEMLGKRWYVEKGTDKVALGNHARYSGYVQGPEQVPIHKERGWLRADEQTEKMLEKLQLIYNRLVDKAWGR